eukprot:2803105-Amphidinium_carterae.1
MEIRRSRGNVPGVVESNATALTTHTNQQILGSGLEVMDGEDVGTLNKALPRRCATQLGAKK